MVMDGARSLNTSYNNYGMQYKEYLNYCICMDHPVCLVLMYLGGLLYVIKTNSYIIKGHIISRKTLNFQVQIDFRIHLKLGNMGLGG